MARLTRVPALVRSAEWATLAPVRRVIDGVLATSMVAGSTFGSATMAMAEPRAPSPVVVQLDQPKGSEAPEPAYRPRPAGDGIARQPESESKATTTTAPAADNGTPEPAPVPAPHAIEATAVPPSTYVVQAGDSLWRIAELHVATASGRVPDDIGVAEVHAYWVHLVETNRHRLRSGDQGPHPSR